MSKMFFPKLAAGNIKKNGKTYIPYILTCILTLSMYYIVRSLSLNPGLDEMAGNNAMSFVLYLGSRIIAVFAVVFLFYTNSFLVKRRKKEFGVFIILGMEKRHLAKVLGWETLYVTLISFAAGMLAGIALDKAMFLVINKVIGGEVSLGFFVSPAAIGETACLFAAIFLLIFLRSVVQLKGATPMGLLLSHSAGEKEPKTNWLLTVAGIVCTGAGYYIALTIRNPVMSLLLFFGAVVLVIAGTYLLFTAGSIALLKTLRRNKRYYYKTKHFVSVSGMIYRMKQNAVGLANICILSTMVLVMVSSTASLMAGIDDVLGFRYPVDFAVYSMDTQDRARESFEEARRLQRQENVHVTNETEYSYLVFYAVLKEDTVSLAYDAGLNSLWAMNNIFIVPLEDYNACMGEDRALQEGEILIYSSREEFAYPTLRLFDREYRIADRLDTFVGNGSLAADVAGTQYIVVPDREEMEEICRLQREARGDAARDIRYFYGFDTDGTEEEQEEFRQVLVRVMDNGGYAGTVEAKAGARQGFVSVYGSFFFLGVFLSVLFVMATVLIIYYKQISEGYDDRERFVIMQKVGMGGQEVRAAIRSQVLTVFFLPLMAAGMHMAAAFPMIAKMLTNFDMFNTALFVGCTLACFAVFAVMYVLIYGLTAKTYYRIVRW